MSDWLTRWQWSLRRQRDDDSRPRTPILKKVLHKATHLLRRLMIVVARPFLRRYAHQALPKLSEVRRILIIPHDPVGDLLLTEPLWRKLKRAKPTLEIGLVVSARNRTLSDVYHEIGARYDFYSGPWWHRVREMRRAKAAGYDVVLAPVGFYKPVRFAIISRYVAGTRGFTATMHHSRAPRYAEMYSYCTERPWQPYPQPMVTQYQALLERVFDIQFEAAERAPVLPLPASVRENAQQIVAMIRERSNCKYVLLAHLEAKVETREWGLANIAALAAALPSAAIIVTASPFYWQRYGASKLPDRLHRVNTASVLDAAALADAVDLVISPDTSLVHFAAAVGTPIVAFYPFRDEWLPYHAKCIVLEPIRRQPISTIAVKTVAESVRELLGEA